jgi:AcrR family transcriptional regulator
MQKRSTPKITAKRRAASSPLGPQSWLDAAWEAMAALGAEGVRAEPLAAKLGVTKGSFYWHFADRAALLAALLDDWEARATSAVIAVIDATGPDARFRLYALVHLTTATPEAPLVEQAVRAWGARDPSTRKRLARVDAKREAYVAALLESAGVAPERAAMRARALYLALIGEYARVAHGGAPTDRATWDELVSRMLERGTDR